MANEPVSGPGRLSKRTDLTQQQGQPTRVPSGGPYGQRKALRQQQGAAAMQSDEPDALPPGLEGGAFGPTQRPREPITAGAPEGPGRNPRPTLQQQDPDLLLRAIYARFPHPDIARILLRRRR